MRSTKTLERKACEKQQLVRLARNGAEVGRFKLSEIDAGAAKGEFFPSDYILIETKIPKWVFLHKVTDTFFIEFSTEKHLDCVAKEESKVVNWITEKKKEIDLCGDAALLQQKQAELKSYKDLIFFLKAIPKLLRKEEETDLEEERLEQKEAKREQKLRLKVFVKIKAKLSKAIKAAKKMQNDADGVENWYQTYFLADTYLKAGQLVDDIRKTAFTEADVEWIAQEIVKKQEFFNDSLSIPEMVDSFVMDVAADVFSRFFKLKLPPG